MIAKHIPMKVTRKSSFGGLVRYITSAQGRDERVGIVRVTNCGSDNPFDAADDVMLVQQSNTRSQADKTYHLIVSFRPGENPTPEVLREIEDRICAGLGYNGHQRISAAHYDTDNLHLHIAINKIHPERFTVHSPIRDYQLLAELCGVLETDLGLERDNHTARKRSGESRAQDMEQIGGLQSLIGWVQRTCADEIKAADSWQSLHAVLTANGLSMRERGNGFVVSAENGISIKASSIARSLSKKALEGRLGPFEAHPDSPAQSTAKRAYEARPVPSRADTAELFERYQEQQKSRAVTRSTELAVASAKRTAAIDAIKRTARLRRAAIKLAGGNGLTRRMSYNLTSRATQKALSKIIEAHQHEKKRIIARNSRMAWTDWLQAEAKAGNAQALAAMLKRDGRKHKPRNAIQGRAIEPYAVSNVVRADHITKRGTIIYRTSKATVRDSGGTLHVSRGAEVEGIAAALQIAQSLYGNELTISGSAEFRERVAQAAASAALPVTFDDPVLERRRQALVNNIQQSKEVPHDRENIGRTNRGSDAPRGRERHTRSGAGEGNGIVGSVRAGRDHGSANEPRAGGAGRATVGKPNIGRPGRSPPPEARDRVRDLSQLGMVRYAERASLLLPRNVHPNMDHAGTRPDRLLRWDFSGAGLTPERIGAAEKYIAEREAKRQFATDILKHRPFMPTGNPLYYSGMREVDGQKLALLKCGEEIMVLPIDADSARRVAKMAKGEKIEIGTDGTVKTRGRGR